MTRSGAGLANHKPQAKQYKVLLEYSHACDIIRNIFGLCLIPGTELL